jgi:NADPH-dependent 2,4-dienoyl-CoA reductase/sulfur reductase-like enzyme/nitrite reductase/ring-hydroxylating ferredoxin subunit
MAEADNAAKPDLTQGVPLDGLADGGMIVGRVGDEDVILARRGADLFAVGASCTHYHGPLTEGVMDGDTVRCPWHHACFSLRTGEALRAPALDPIACWRVERVGGNAFVRDKISAPQRAKKLVRNAADPIVIVGGGAAGLAAADMLRREGFDGGITLISADSAQPCDRPNLSKDYLAGTAQEDWIPLRPPEYYTQQRIELVLDARVASLDVKQRRVQLDGGKTYGFGALLLATGAEPVRIPVPGATDSQVHYLRTFADSRAIVAKAASARRVVVVGASFIGLEVAASLRARNIEVHVVAPDKVPLERVMGTQVGAFVRKLHEQHGVVFHLGQTVNRVEGSRATLSDGSGIEADFIVLGVGVRPSITLGEQAGLTVDRGIAVDEYLQTSAPGIFAAGDIARWPDPHSGERIRVEHWVVAQRQGQVAAKNMLGQRVKFDAVPFFWSQHYDLAINYVGHAEKWDKVEIDGSLDAKDCAVTYKLGKRTLAVATIFRDLQSLQAELAMERTS